MAWSRGAGYDGARQGHGGRPILEPRIAEDDLDPVLHDGIEQPQVDGLRDAAHRGPLFRGGLLKGEGVLGLTPQRLIGAQPPLNTGGIRRGHQLVPVEVQGLQLSAFVSAARALRTMDAPPGIVGIAAGKAH